MLNSEKDETKMQLPGFEPGTSRVWGERDNQLHHSCQLTTWDYEPSNIKILSFFPLFLIIIHILNYP